VGMEKRQGGKMSKWKRKKCKKCKEKTTGGKGEDRRVGIPSKRCFEWEEGDQKGKGARSCMGWNRWVRKGGCILV
jgi:hypothetical protein